MIQDCDDVKLRFIDPTRFEKSESGKVAYGGIQIVKGDYARKFGYVPRGLYSKPVNPDLGFQQCKGDVAFRRQVKTSEAVDIPNVYRIRHSRCGRDGGVIDHRRKS